MVKQPKVPKNKVSHVGKGPWSLSYFWQQFLSWRRAKRWHRIVIGIATVVFLFTGCMWGVAEWYILKHRHEPLKIGATFIAPYARYFELDAQDTLHAMLSDLGLRRVRLVSYWEEIEKKPGQYDFSDLDWQFAMAKKYNAEVTLSLGLRQPRWPECHMPSWAEKLPKSQWQPALYKFITATVNHYKDNSTLQSYQLENEYFLQVFGECSDFDKQRLIEELALVKNLDSSRPVIINRSNNAVPSWPVRGPLPDTVGAAVYKRVWDRTVTKRYFEYPLPAWYYGFLAGGGELTTGRDTILHELQIEPWLPDGVDLKSSSIEEQDHTMNADLVDGRIRYGIATGMRTIDLWGVEWWYYRKVKLHDTSIWEAGKQTLRAIEAETTQ